MGRIIRTTIRSAEPSELRFGETVTDGTDATPYVLALLRFSQKTAKGRKTEVLERVRNFAFHASADQLGNLALLNNAGVNRAGRNSAEEMAVIVSRGRHAMISFGLPAGIVREAIPQGSHEQEEDPSQKGP